MEQYKKIWLLCLGGFLFLGLIISLVNISSTGYYQKQNYNNLPSMQSYETPKPQPIQHYEEMRDESVEKTEEINVVERLPENSSIISSFNDNKMIILNEDGSFDFMAMVIFFGAFWGLYIGMKRSLFYMMPRPRDVTYPLIIIFMIVMMFKLLGWV